MRCLSWGLFLQNKIHVKFIGPNLFFLGYCVSLFKDTHREKAPKKLTPRLTKNTNMDIWVAGTIPLFKRF